MRIRFRTPARATLRFQDESVAVPPGVNGMRLAGGLECHLDQDVADRGVRGGEIHAIVEGDRVFVAIDFWTPDEPSAEIVERLTAFVGAQLSDGIGEGGFEIDVENAALELHADDEGPFEVSVSDDGRAVPPISVAAIAAREGDLAELRRVVEADPARLEERLLGCTPLHLALLYGRAEAAEWLISAGADPHARSDTLEATPLEACVTAYRLADADSARLATLLRARGADATAATASGMPLVELALIRGKTLTAEALR